MRIRWLGWAGVEIEAEGATLAIDPLGDVDATFAPLGERARDGVVPDVVAPESGAVAGLVTHLHRDHADAAALTAALAPDAAVLEPLGSEPNERSLGLAQADAELQRAGIERRPMRAWEEVEAGPFRLTALPAVDGLGDPQVSWLVEAGGMRALHLGDTMFHAYWWPIVRRHGPIDVVLAPINGAVVDFPHLQPPSPLAAAMEPEQAALAGELLRARSVVPIHYGGYDVEPWYRPVADPIERFEAAAAGRPYEARVLDPGAELEVSPEGLGAATALEAGTPALAPGHAEARARP
jgi:L-ascorbate metabolism protein UlaG (beta-lactamase superfamily)